MEESVMVEDPSLERETDDFERLFKSHYPMVVRQIMRIISSQSVAEDVAQDVFLQLYHTDRTGIENLPAWLTKTAINTAYNHVRSEKRYRARMEKEAHVASEFLPSSENKWLEQEDILAVRRILSQMNERDRNLLLMKYSGFSYDELAQAIQIKKGSVGSLLSRAKKQFQKLYQRRGDGC
ncbi:RNA polymerase sigma factor SigX [Salinithrix halophila]|uniref:RNA polymerase sigma factor SigX n=1 Tax=Salinithrix halophila TaxID=1485204 RepID=A0ABV8JF38_9BACL